jgi:general nucleoside transport system permease protein
MEAGAPQGVSPWRRIALYGADTRARRAMNTLGALLASVAVLAAVFLALGADPFMAFNALWTGAFGNSFILGQTIMITTVLVLTGLAAAVPFSASLWNVGGEGQLFFGAFASTAVALTVTPSLSPWLFAPLALIAGGVAGGVWGLIPGALKALFDVNEVIVTLMLTFIAILLCNYAITELWPQGASRGTRNVPAASELPNIWSGTPVTAGALVAVVAVVVAWVVMARTWLGFDIRASGLNARAAKLNGVHVRRAMIWSFVLGGMFAGLAGGVAILGMNHALISGFSANWGFLGIAVALVAGLKPLWMIPSALIFATFQVGSGNLQVEVGISPTVGQVMGATFIILLLAFHVIRMRYAEGA